MFGDGAGLDAGDAGQPVPPTNGTALPASPPAWEISFTTFGVEGRTAMTVEAMTETLLLASPSSAVAREAIIQYCRGMAKFRDPTPLPKLFEYSSE